MSIADICLDQFKKEIASVRKAPFTFAIAFAIASIIGSGSLYWAFNWEMWNVFEMKKTLIAALTEENERLKSSKDIKQRSETEEQKEKKDLVAIEGRVFSHEQVILDGFSYRNCTFDNVVFLFNGGPGEIINCTLKAGKNGFLSFNKPIERTIKILHTMGMLRAEINPLAVLKPGPTSQP